MKLFDWFEKIRGVVRRWIISSHRIQTCPSRLWESGPWVSARNMDYWREDYTCSFCGSYHPDEAMRFLRRGGTIVPTDNQNKAYLESNAAVQLPGEARRRKIYFHHFQNKHKIEFVNLLYQKKLNIAYPGHFYVLPAFIFEER
jgi:hypothetical protein